MLGAYPLASTPIASLGRKEVTASGELTAPAHMINGQAQYVVVVQGYGALTSAAHTLLGLSAVNRNITADGALMSFAQSLAGISAVQRQIEADSALFGIAHQLFGIAAVQRQIEADGALIAPAQELFGLGVPVKVVTADGALIAPAGRMSAEASVFGAIQAYGAMTARGAVVTGRGIKPKTSNGYGDLVGFAPDVEGLQYARDYVYTTKPPVNLFLNARASSDEPDNLGWVKLFQSFQYKVLDPESGTFRTVNVKYVLTGIVATSPTGVPEQIAVSVFNMDETARNDMFEKFDVPASGLVRLPVSRSICDPQDVYVFKSVGGAEVHLTASFIASTEEEFEVQ